jgi:hypothetical protein
LKGVVSRRFASLIVKFRQGFVQFRFGESAVRQHDLNWSTLETDASMADRYSYYVTQQTNEGSFRQFMRLHILGQPADGRQQYAADSSAYAS